MEQAEGTSSAAGARLSPWRRLRRVLGGRSEGPGVLRLEYPPSASPGPRYGYGRPQHPGLADAIAAHRDAYRRELEAILPFADDLSRIAVRDPRPGEPCWLNAWLPPLDTAALYAYLRRSKPARYLEVGSGYSTAVARRAQRDGALQTTITSIDPSPRRDVDELCDEVVREALECTDLDRFFGLEAGDVVFFDGSHRVFENSDVVAFYLDVLPNLPGGVIVGIHDVLWPDDYLPLWTEAWFSEQYLLGAYLLARAPFIEPLLAGRYATEDAELRAVLDPLWSRPALAELHPGGSAFWLRARAGSA